MTTFKGKTKEKVLVLTGPTASGKSSLSMKLSKHIPIEIICADSMQVYRHMDIGTAKPSLEDRKKVKHHLFDIRDADEGFSVQEFCALSSQTVEDIAHKGMIPCFVGGTGLYLRALLWDYPLGDASPDIEFRKKMRLTAEEKGNEYLHSLLMDKDPKAWETIHPNDIKRVIRALEYFEKTGYPISKRKETEPRQRYDHKIIALSRPREELYLRIEKRVEEQFRQGFVEEVQKLIDLGYDENAFGMQGLGYKEVQEYLKGNLSLDETKDLIKRNTRRYAKRQITWFSKEKGITWIEAGNHRTWDELVSQSLDIIGQDLR